MLRLIIIIILIAIPINLASQEAQTVVFRDGEKVYIRWFGDRNPDNSGYNFYRMQSGEWQKLNNQILTRTYDLDEIRNSSGDYIGGIYLSLFGGKELRDIQQSDYVNVINNNDALTFLNLMTFVYPAIGKLMGEYYVIDIKSENESYKITTINNGIETDWALIEGLDTKAIDAVPEPSELDFQPQNQQILLYWEIQQDLLDIGEIVSYNIYRAENIAGPYVLVNPQGFVPLESRFEDNEKVNSFLDRNLDNEKEYFYYMKSVNSFGIESRAGKIISAKPGENRIPPAPSDIEFELQADFLNISWDYNSRIEAKGYELYKSESDSGSFTKIYPISDKLLDANRKNFYDTDIKAGRRYFYYLRSINSNGDASKPSDTLSFFIEDDQPPLPPKNLEAIGDTNKIILKWDANTEDDILGYRIYRSGDKSFKSRFTLTNNNIQDTFFIDQLSNYTDTEFGYIVYAIDNNYNRSEPSEMAFAKMIDTQAPLPPSIERLYQNDSVIYIRWNRSEADDLAKYNIYRSKSDTNSFELIAEEEDIFINLEYDISGNYYFKMTAQDSDGNESPFSATRKLTIKINEIPAPINGTLDTNKRSIELKWTVESEDKIAGFFIQRKDIKSGNIADLAYLKANELSFTDWNVEFDAEYEYYIFAHNEKWTMSKPLLIKYNE